MWRHVSERVVQADVLSSIASVYYGKSGGCLKMKKKVVWHMKCLTWRWMSGFPEVCDAAYVDSVEQPACIQCFFFAMVAHIQHDKLGGL